MQRKEDNRPRHEEWAKKSEEFKKDPIKFLENRKKEIESLLLQGKISKEKAQSKIKRIDSKIKEIREFEKLSLKQKKEKLIKDCEIYLNKKMESGNLTQQEAEQIFKDFVDKINTWNGSGYPMFYKKGFKHKD
jgi:lipoate-protein ligase A